jgi:hypothetical protein
MKALLWWLKNYKIEFFGLKFYFSTHFHLKTSNKHHKNFHKSLVNLKTPPNQPRRPKSNEAKKSK